MAHAILKIPILSTLITTTTIKLSKSLLNSSSFHGYGRGICCCSSAAYVSQQQQRQPQVRSPQLVALEYADLSIPHIVSEVLKSQDKLCFCAILLLTRAMFGKLGYERIMFGKNQSMGV